MLATVEEQFYAITGVYIAHDPYTNKSVNTLMSELILSQIQVIQKEIDELKNRIPNADPAVILYIIERIEYLDDEQKILEAKRKLLEPEI
jgi:ribosome-binding ATPase YchF (GTP1/OBG family)